MTTALPKLKKKKETERAETNSYGICMRNVNIVNKCAAQMVYVAGDLIIQNYKVINDHQLEIFNYGLSSQKKVELDCSTSNWIIWVLIRLLATVKTT